MKFVSQVMVIVALALNTCVLSQYSSSSEEDFDDVSMLKRGILDKLGMCFRQSDCLPSEYCDNLTKNSVFGRCLRKGKDGDYCMYDHRCLSNHCHSFKCKGKPATKNIQRDGVCKTDEECHHEQYCESKKCRNRQLKGSCSSDSHCMSNHCSFFKCKN